MHLSPRITAVEFRKDWRNGCSTGQNEWLSTPLTKASYFVTHIVSMFNVEDVIAHHNCFLRQPFFDNVVDRIIANIIDGDWDE